MKKFYFLFLLLIVTVKFVGGQTLLAGWDFQTTANGGTSIVGTPSTQQSFISNVGLGTLYLDGTNGSSNWLQTTELDGFAGTSINAGGSTGLSTVMMPPASLGLRNGSANSANNKAIVFKFSMTGYKNLVVSYATSSTSTGFNSQSWAYSLNGVTWTNIQTIIPSTAFTLQNLATITSLDNAGTAYLRLIVSGASGINNQSNKLDNIQFNATSICGGSQLWSGNTGTDWNIAGNWCNGTIPTISSIVNIPSGLTNYPVISTADALAASVTISNGASLNMSGPYNLTLSSGATFTNSGTFTGAANTGAVIFAGSGTVAGAVSFNNVTINGAVDFGGTAFVPVSTVTGSLILNSGSSLSGATTHQIVYGPASSLIYNLGTSQIVGNEWARSASPNVPGLGVPYNVTVQNNSTIAISNTNPGTWTPDRSISGVLTIASGSSLSSSSFHDLYVAGNWVNNGLYNPNGQTVTLDGTATQIVSGTNSFYNLTLSNTIDFGTSSNTIQHTFSNSSGVMNGNASTFIFTGSPGFIIGSNSKNFYNLQVISGANITHTTGGGNVHVDNSYINNGNYTEGSTYTIYFDKNSGTTSLSGSGTTIFGNVTIGQSGTIGLGTILNANAHSFTVSGTNFTFNHSSSIFNGGTSTVIFNSSADLIGTAMSVTGSIAAFYGVTVLNATTMGIDITVNGPLSIMNAANKLVINGNTLSLNGTVTGSGSLTGSSTSNITVGTSGSVGTLNFDQAIGNTTNVLKDFKVNNGATATIGNALNIVAGTSPGTVTANGTINAGNFLTLRSDINGTSRVATSLGSINGNVTVERYIATGPSGGVNHGKSWQLLAIPTQGQTIKNAWQEGALIATGSTLGVIPSGSNPIPGYGTMLTSDIPGAKSQPTPGFDEFTTPGPSIKYYSPVANTYVGPLNTNTTPIYNQKGYFVFVRGDRSVNAFNQAANPTILRTKGTLFTAANPPLTTTVPVSVNGFESVGNPYASAIDFRNVGKSGNISLVFQVWDPRLGGGYNYGAFQTIVYNPFTLNYEASPAGGSYGLVTDPNNLIQSGQAFFVQTTNPALTGTITFDENSKAGGSLLVTSPVRTPSLRESIRIKLYSYNDDGTTGLVDGVLTDFDATFSNSMDALDARKLTNTGENLSIKSSNQLLAVERRQGPTAADTIFLSLTDLRILTYRFEVVTSNMNNGGLQGFLEDTYLNSRMPIDMNGTTYSDFNVISTPGSYAPDRFRIVFTSVNAGPLPVTFTSVKATAKGDVINVEWQVDNELNIKNYTMEKSVDGIHFNTLKVTDATGNGGRSASYLVVDSNPVEGYNYYRIRSNDQDGKISLTQVVKAFIGSLKHDIVVNPNPITNGNITLQFQNMPAGKYNIRLLNKLGQVIMKKQVTRMEGNNTEILKWNFNLAHGMYQLEITKPDSGIKNINIMY